MQDFFSYKMLNWVGVWALGSLRTIRAIRAIGTEEDG